MHFSTDVNLPKKHKAKFPDRCVVCGAESPESSVCVAYWSYLSWGGLKWNLSRRFAADAPACKSCRWTFQHSRVSALLFFYALLGICIWYFLPFIDQAVPRLLRKWAILGMGGVCLIPYIVMELYSPKTFDITVFKDSVDYEFRNPDYAYEFAELNEDAEWVKVT